MRQDSPESTDERPTLGQQLRTARLARSLTATQLGALAGVSAASVSRFEAGTLSPSAPTLERLADALDLDIAALV